MLMYQVIKTENFGTSDLVNVYSLHLSEDKEEAKWVFNEILSEYKVGINNVEIIDEANNQTTIFFENGSWTSISLNEIETSDGVLEVELN